MINLALARDILTGKEDSFASIILGLVLQEFGTECFDWETETLELEIKDSFGVTMTPIVKNRLFAAITVLTTDIWERDPIAFNNICNAFGDGSVSMTVLEIADPQEVGWALTEITLLDRPEPLDPESESVENKLNEDVHLFIADILANFAVAPKGLFAFMKGKYDINTQGWGDDPALALLGYKQLEENYKLVEDYVTTNIVKLKYQMSALNLEPSTQDKAK